MRIKLIELIIVASFVCVQLDYCDFMSYPFILNYDSS